MSTNAVEIRVGGLGVQIVRKDIKNLHLGVYPPNGRVRVAVPLSVSDDAVRLAVIGKLAWIRKRQAQFAAQPRQTEREMVSGESHYFLGRRYRLRVVECDGSSRVVLRNRSTLELQVNSEYGPRERGQVLRRWYLAKKPPQCLEYIIVHELTHLIEPHHNDRFVSLMDRHMPQWRSHRKALNGAPLGHADWSY